MRIRVTHTLGDLEYDLESMPARLLTEGRKIVRKNAREGNRLARRIAKSEAGPHGKAYYKRLSEEMTGPLSAEYGPHGPPKSDYVGVSGTEGAMRDLDKSADVIGPKFADAAGDMLDRLFW